jgi:hypothetical protein
MEEQSQTAGLELPVDEETRKFIDDAFDWMIQEFGLDGMLRNKTLTPTRKDFPFKMPLNSDALSSLVGLVCTQLEVDPSLVHLATFDDETPHEKLFPTIGEYRQGAAGLYFATDKNGHSYIAINYKQLHNPQGLVASLAHEIAHVRILGERRLKRDDESHEIYADLLTIFYGFGLFTAASAFQVRNWTEGYRAGWSMQSSGYLSLRQIGYALALYANKRNEAKPKWKRYIASSVLHYFSKSIKVMKHEARSMKRTGAHKEK